MARTLQQRFQQGLETLGAKVTPYNSGRYVVMTRPKGGYYFLGSAGSLRVGACVARSIPCNETFRNLLLASVPTSDRVALNTESENARVTLT